MPVVTVKSPQSQPGRWLCYLKASYTQVLVVGALSQGLGGPAEESKAAM